MFSNATPQPDYLMDHGDRPVTLGAYIGRSLGNDGLTAGLRVGREFESGGGRSALLTLTLPLGAREPAVPRVAADALAPYRWNAPAAYVPPAPPARLPAPATLAAPIADLLKPDAFHVTLRLPEGAAERGDTAVPPLTRELRRIP